jgi:hypothetical protein
MVMCGVLFEVRNESLNIIKTSVFSVVKDDIIKYNRRITRQQSKRIIGNISVHQSTSREAAPCSASQEILYSFWNSKDHYSVHKSPKLDNILQQLNAAHILSRHSFTSAHCLTNKSVKSERRNGSTNQWACCKWTNGIIQSHFWFKQSVKLQHAEQSSSCLQADTWLARSGGTRCCEFFTSTAFKVFVVQG